MRVPDKPGYWIHIVKYPKWVFTGVKYISDGHGMIVQGGYVGGVGPNPRHEWVGPFASAAEAENMMGTP